MTFKCSGCGTTLDAPDLKPGELCECPNCSETVEVPFPKIKGSKLAALRRTPPSSGASNTSSDPNQAVLKEMKAQTDHLEGIRGMLRLFVWIYVIVPFIAAILVLISHGISNLIE